MSGPPRSTPFLSTQAPPIAAVLETVLYTDDLERAAGFYGDGTGSDGTGGGTGGDTAGRGVMGLALLYGDARMRAFDVGGRGTLLLFPRGGTRQPVETPGGAIPPHDGAGPLHIAFSIEKAALEPWCRHLAASGVAIESRVDWPRGGTSVYFRDPDGHLLELATPGLWPGY